ncbi:MAG TPA: DUF1080 domain-containing protein [Planctomycetota bacterium]|nr:DUF1080 domain-containing protein [Planctomycetota bacterium]
MKVAWMVVMAALAGLGQDSKSALESDPSGWVDVFPGKDFKGWKRLPLDPGAPLATKAVWSHSEDGKMLRCDGTGGVKELLLNDEERGDGIFHVEWRWGKDQGEKPTYNGGIYLRSSEDGRTWIQAQVARGPKPPVVGDFIGMLMEDGKPKRTDLPQKGPSREAPVGEWNTYEITCKGKTITLWVNGAVTCVWEDFPLPKGRLGLQAEFAAYEFRSLKWKKL